MALSFTTHLSLIRQMFLFIPFMTVLLAQAAPIEKDGFKREIVLKSYIIEIQSGPNATVIPVAGVAGKRWSSTNFGTILVGDNPVVEDPNPYSRRIGRVRGLVVAVSKDGRYNYISSSTMFTDNSIYNGSTLQAQGTFDRASRAPSELSIVGGTKMFKGARGIVILQTYSNIVLLFIFKISLPKYT